MPVSYTHLSGHSFQQHQAGNASKLLAAVRKQTADVLQPRCAQQGVHNGVDQHVRVGVTLQPLFIGDVHPAQNQLPPGHQPMHIIAVADS